MRRISGAVLVVGLFLAACTQPDDLNVGLEPQLGATETTGIDLAIGASSYAIITEQTSTYGETELVIRSEKVTLSRFDTEGNILWERNVFGFSYGAVGGANDFPPSLDQGLVDIDGSGNAYGFTEASDAGYCPGNGSSIYRVYDGRLTKLSPTGARLWSKKITGSVDGFAVDRAGNSYLAGVNDTQPCNDAVGPILFLRKYAPDGSLVWSRGLNDRPESLAVTPWGSAFVTTGNYVDGEPETQLSRYTVEGKLLWKKMLVDLDPYNDKDNWIAFSKNGFYALTSGYGNQELQTKLNKYDLSGNLVWSRTYVGAKEGVPDSTFETLTVDPAENVIMVGSYDATPAYYDGIIRKVSPTGKTLWTKTPQSLQGVSLSSVGNRDNGGSIYLGGVDPTGSSSLYGGSDRSSLVSRLDRGGNQAWTIR